MRITADQQRIIARTLRHHFGADSRILLFGSRVDDTRRGGDIDLYIEPDKADADELVQAKLQSLALLHRELGNQKIDLVINRPNGTPLPIHRVARQTGLPL